MNEKIISRIEKLLALAGNNPSAEEAQEAMMKAQEMMAKYNLDLSQMNNPSSDNKEAVHDYVKGYHNTAWALSLAKVICDNFRCNLLRAPGYGLVIIGLKEDVEICKTVFLFAANVLDKNMAKLRRQYRKRGLSTEGISGDYSWGFIAGLKAKYQEQVEREGWGLVLVKDSAVVKYTQEIINPNKKGSSGRRLHTSGNSELYFKGYQDGKTLGNPHECLA